MACRCIVWSAGRSLFHAAAVRRREGYGPTPLPRETAVLQADKLRSAELLQQQQDEATRELRSASAATTKQLIERTRELERLSKENEDVTAQVRQRLSAAAFALDYSGRTWAYGGVKGMAACVHAKRCFCVARIADMRSTQPPPPMRAPSHTHTRAARACNVG